MFDNGAFLHIPRWIHVAVKVSSCELSILNLYSTDFDKTIFVFLQ